MGHITSYSVLIEPTTIPSTSHDAPISSMTFEFDICNHFVKNY